jgi:hypothetical protein
MTSNQVAKLLAASREKFVRNVQMPEIDESSLICEYHDCSGLTASVLMMETRTQTELLRKGLIQIREQITAFKTQLRDGS